MDATEVARRLALALEAAHVPYAIGGAIAYGFFGAPRGTYDVGLNLFLPAEEASQALGVLRAAGLDVDVAAAVASGAERGDAHAHYQGMRVDLFFNSIPLHESAATRTVAVALLGSRVNVLSPEDTAVFKLLFFRGKDLSDVERLLGVAGAALDRDYVRRWLVATVGEDDARVAKWDALAAAIPAA